MVEKLIVKFNENDNKIQLIRAENEVKIVREGITATVTRVNIIQTKIRLICTVM